ncbi:MAG: type II toxin-antitoxin system HicA family toxin [Terriglobales bacterium]
MPRKRCNCGLSLPQLPPPRERSCSKYPFREPALSCSGREASCQRIETTRLRAGRPKGQSSEMAHANGRQVIVAVHGNKPIPVGTLKSIIEGSGLDVDDFR